MAKKRKYLVENTLKKLTSENPEIRREGWETIYQHSALFRKSLNEAQIHYLENLMEEEKDLKTYRIANKAMLALALRSSDTILPFNKRPLSRTSSKMIRDTIKLLAIWLWYPFGKASAVLAVTATNYCRRDENAQIWLARRLSFSEFNKTDFPHISLENPEVEGVFFSDKYHAFCIVGRLGLFGSKALQRFSNNDLRFGFVKHRRPIGLPPGELDAEYHCVFERTKNSRRIFYRTTEENGERTDYVVIQRYQVKLDGTRTVVVIIIAGASSLGTLAGARWAAYNLFQPTDTIDKGPIPVPRGISPHSTMEVLLRARAKVTTGAWDHPEIDLLQLYVDGASWSLKDQAWHKAAIKQITIIRDKGQATKILFDNQPTRLDPRKQMFRLLVAVAQKSLQCNYSELDITALNSDDTIWEKPKPGIPYVRYQLRLLRNRYLRESLQTRGHLQFNARVRILDKP
ncbi:MAG: hypothetical protein JW829_07925 [Pirellulales bacterium]|nr:hypothetical protein [Pirellulales bacterium]